MPKKKPQTDKTFTVLIGCNTSDEVRYEVGDTVKESELKESDVSELLEMGAIEEAE